MTNEPFDPAATQPFEPLSPEVTPTGDARPAFQSAADQPPSTPAFSQAAVPPPVSPAFQPAAVEPEPVRAQPVKSSSGGSRVLNVVLGVAVLVAVAGVAFAAGRSTAPASAATLAAGNGGFPNGAGGFRGNGGYFPGNGGYFPGNGEGGFGQGGGAGRFGFGGLSISGTVDSVTADSVTIKTASGQTVTIGLDGSTTYHQQAAASASDVQAGKTVIVQLSGGLRPGAGANGNNGTGGSITLGAAGDVTVVP